MKKSMAKIMLRQVSRVRINRLNNMVPNHAPWTAQQPKIDREKKDFKKTIKGSYKQNIMIDR